MVFWLAKHTEISTPRSWALLKQLWETMKTETPFCCSIQTKMTANCKRSTEFTASKKELCLTIFEKFKSVIECKKTTEALLSNIC